jgi:hypothetical protein
MLGAEDPELGTDRFLSSGEVLSLVELVVKSYCEDLRMALA